MTIPKQQIEPEACTYFDPDTDNISHLILSEQYTKMASSISLLQFKHEI